jgi:protease II
MAVAAEVVVDTPKAPVAKKVSHVMEMHGDKREDNYYWIRDDDRKDPDVLAYLNEENAYTEALMEGACWSPCVLILYMHNKMPQRPSPDHCILYL